MIAVLDMMGAGCPSCAFAIERAARRMPGVRDVRVDIARSEICLDFDGNEAVLEGVIAAVRKFGHDAVVKGREAASGECPPDSK